MSSKAERMAQMTAQLLETFREETGEGLDVFEAKLLELLDRPDAELIDQLFRVAHTIKGGAGTFAMTAMTRLAHRMESVLDGYRSGSAPTRAAVDTLLEATDVLRTLLAGGASPADQPALEARLEAASRRDAAAPAPSRVPVPAPAPAIAAPPPPRAPAPARPARHAIAVAPAEGMFRGGVDPRPLFDQLASLGELDIAVDTAAVPPLAELDPTTCHLRWTLALTGSSPEFIHALFGWLEDLCPISVAPLPAPAAVAAAPATPAAPLTPRAVRSAGAAAARDPGGGSIRVRLDKLDGLMKLIGDLVITQSTLCTLKRGLDTAGADRLRVHGALDDLQRLTRLLQQGALQLRSMPIGTVLARFPRLVHDLAQQLGKQIELEVVGEATELDRTVLERIGDPLVHLLRNSIDHGIELPAVREAAGKSPTGRIRITVEQRGDEVLLEIADDGRGLDAQRILARARERGLVGPDQVLSEAEIHRLIWLPGFSTAEKVSDVSGRGIGMDVVVRTLQDLGGDVQLRSQLGAGTVISLRLPLTLAIIDAQLISCGGRTWVVPLSHVVECDRLERAAVTLLVGQRPVYRVGDDVIPLIDLTERMALGPPGDRALVLIVESNGERRALAIDDIGARQQVVIKSLSAQLARVDHLTGATILGDGSVAFILDIPSLCSTAERSAA